MTPRRVSFADATVRPPALPPSSITPPKVPVPLLSVRVLAPRLTLPAPSALSRWVMVWSLAMVSAPVPCSSTSPDALTMSVLVETEPSSFRVVPASTVVVPV